MYERTEIPKDCLLCDTCNTVLTDDKFIATEDSAWHQGWLYCTPCQVKYTPSMPLILAIKKGDDLSQTDLARPMVFESW
jgi:hypothetical protein